MILCKGFNGEHMEELACAIMYLRNSEACITSEDMKRLIGNAYYAVDTEDDSIIAIVSGVRKVCVDEYAEGEPRVCNQYFIDDFLYDHNSLECHTQQEICSTLCNLLREFDADKNDWSIKYMIPSEVDEDELIHRALRTNGFIKHVDGKFYLRVIGGIDFSKLYG